MCLIAARLMCPLPAAAVLPALVGLWPNIHGRPACCADYPLRRACTADVDRYCGEQKKNADELLNGAGKQWHLLGFVGLEARMCHCCGSVHVGQCVVGSRRKQ